MIADRRVEDAAGAVQIQLRLRLPLITLAILLIVAFLLPDQVWNTLLVGLGGVFVVAYVWTRSLASGLHAARQLRFGWVSVGDRLEEEFTLWNRSFAPALWVEISDYANIPGYQTAVVQSVAENSVTRWRASAVCQQRGQFQLGPWHIRSGDPFGIFTVTRRYPASSEIIIHPPIHGRLPIPLPVGQSSGQVRARQRAWLATVNAATVRNYHPQDPYRWIHWPTSARRDELFVREFDLDAAGDVWLLLDMRQATQLGQGTGGTEEHAVLLAASLAARALQQNRAVGLAAYDRQPHVILPGRGAGQQWRLLRALAIVQANGHTSLKAAIRDLSRAAQRGTTAVLITPDGTADWLPDLLHLTRKGVQSNVILLDRVSFGGQGNSAGLCDAVRQLGFACHVVRQGEVGQPLQEAERRGHWEFRITPFGKAVPIRAPQKE